MTGFSISDFLQHLDHADGRVGASDLAPGLRLVHIVDAGLAFPASAERELWKAKPMFVAVPDRTPAGEDAWQAASDAMHAAQVALGDDDQAQPVTDRPDGSVASLGRA